VTDIGVVTVHADGSGTFTGGSVTYTVHSDGAGTYTDSEQTYTVAADGSGTWTYREGVVDNNGDGSGSWVGPDGPVTVAGDGTGSVIGLPVTVAPMAKFALLGKLPKLNTLKPVGTACGTLIRLSAGVLFDFDKDILRPSAVPLLAAVATALKGSTKAIQVNGHTDSKGADAYNLDLSRRRAATVAKALQGDGLTAPLSIHGFGEAQPVAPNSLKGADNPVGRQLNRRVELVIP
jgi:OmpA-OmpF porin, OOP family